MRAAFALERPRERREHGLSLLEGRRLVLDCLRSGAPLVELFLDEALPGAERDELLGLAARAGAASFETAAGLLARLSAQDAAQGVAATVRVPDVALEAIWGRSPLLVCHALQNPGNVGAIVRVAAALGAGAVLATGGSDPFGPKALRAAAGATFRLPVARLGEAALAPLCEEAARHGYLSLVAEPRGGRSHRRLALGPAPVALLLGSEGSGFSDASIPEALQPLRVTIELNAEVESLNVAVAAGILLDRLVEALPQGPESGAPS